MMGVGTPMFHGVLKKNKKEQSIRINQLGYNPQDKKIAVLTKESEKFQIMNQQKKVCFEGKVTYFGYDNEAGEEIWHADFTQFSQLGKYTMVLEDGEESYPFEISNQIYDSLLYATMKVFYYLRCGCELKPEDVGEYHHKPCHIQNAIVWDNKAESKEVSGGWHDAGDYGRYVTPGACTLGHLLFAYRLYPQVLQKVNLKLPDHVDGVPDVLTECKYELNWLLKMQREDGAVYHKATTKNHAPFVMPDEDREPMYLLPITSVATADFAGICAMASEIYEPFDQEFANRLLESAILAGQWLDANPEYLCKNCDECKTGTYMEDDDIDNRFWAWSALYAATGKKEYHDRFMEYAKQSISFVKFGTISVGGFGALSYLLCKNRDRDQRIKDKFKVDIIREAEELMMISKKSGYEVAMSIHEYCWGSNYILTQHGMIFAIADYLEGKHRFLTYVKAQLNYLLGVNAAGYSYVTGVGTLATKNPHFRPTFAHGYIECIPGMVAGGPNVFLNDPTAKRLLKQGTPAMKCYIDHVDCYSLNEIAIYWNSTTVFLISAICSYSTEETENNENV